MHLFCVLVTFTALFIVVAAHSDQGFVLSHLDGSCGGIYEGIEGSITTPGYPDKYVDDVDCVWKVKSPEYTVIQINFEHFYTMNNDYLDIRDGNNSSAPSLAHCSIHGCKDVTSTSNHIYFRFHPVNDGYTHDGFKLKWMSVGSSCYNCDSSPDSLVFDPTCGRDGYHGKTTPYYGTCYSNVHYDGSHRVERGGIEHTEENGSCFDTGYSLSCFCRGNHCNNHLCKNCSSTTPSPITISTEPGITTQPPITSMSPSPMTTTQAVITSTLTSVSTTQPSTTTDETPAPGGPLQCYSCFDCNIINQDTNIESSEEFLSCFTGIALGNDNFVIRGGSPDFHEDGTCRHEADGVFMCFCLTNRCNSDAATDLRAN